MIMKYRIIFLVLTTAMLVQGCAYLQCVGRRPDLLVVVTADKTRVHFGEKVVLTLRITNSTATAADFGDARKIKIRGEMKAIECPFPCCMLGLYFDQKDTIQAAASLGEFHVPAGQSYEINREIVLTRDRYPFPAGTYLGEFKGKPRNWQGFSCKTVPVRVTVGEQ
jgi:hypothetical protein